MLQTRGSATVAELRTVNGFMAGCRLLYQREGARGFFKGVRPRVLTTMPSTAICWSAYEASKWVSPRNLAGLGCDADNFNNRAYFIHHNTKSTS